MTPATITLAPTASPRDLRFRIELRRDLCACGSRSATTRGAVAHCDKCGTEVALPKNAISPQAVAHHGA